MRLQDEDEPSGQQNTSQDDEFGFSKYDEEGEQSGVGLGIASLTLQGAEEEHFSDSESEKEDDLIKPDDNLIVVGHVEGDASVLEIYGKLFNYCHSNFVSHVLHIQTFYKPCLFLKCLSTIVLITTI